MTIFEFAEGLNGREYRKEITPLEEQWAKELGFVVVFGYSDDNTEFRGAYDEEIECFNGGRVYEDEEKYIDAVWCEGEYLWVYKTNIQHATFDVYEDGGKYCKGIVFEKECKRLSSVTNYDRIKAMSVEEMALMLMCPAEYDLSFNKKCECNGEFNRDCNECCKNWLESEV